MKINFSIFSMVFITLGLLLSLILLFSMPSITEAIISFNTPPAFIALINSIFSMIGFSCAILAYRNKEKKATTLLIISIIALLFSILISYLLYPLLSLPETGLGIEIIK